MSEKKHHDHHLFHHKHDHHDVDVGTAEDVDKIMRKFDRESNTRIWSGKAAMLIRLITVAFSVFCICSTLFSVAALEKRLTSFLAFIVIIGYLNYPFNKHHVRENYLPWYDILLMGLGAASFLFYYFGYDSLVKVLTSASRMTPALTVVGVVGILVLIELCRRCVGLPILFVAGALLIYTFSTGIGLQRLIYTLFFMTTGVLSTPIQVCAKYIVVFIIFGAFLERTGIAAMFIQFANALVGRFSGGPAKAAVVASALEGMVSGSSVANTVGSGSITIPLMKRLGYKPEFAGAVEAAASTGGQIMPPIMGAAAFLMAEYIGITYAEVATRAILPAALYFTGIFIAVHLEAKKLGLQGMRREELPRLRSMVKKLYLLLPLVLLVSLVGSNKRTMQFSATVCIFAAIAVGLINNVVNKVTRNPDKSENLSFGKVLEALEAGGKSAITVAVACAMAGIIAGCITATGLASKLISAVVSISNQVTILNPVLVAMFLTMLCCIVLGMGVPTTANYCIMASTCAPILIEIGVPRIAAHFFVFYFGIVADITPPVALAAYAGSAIAKSNPMKTGVNATKLAIGAFIVPYIFGLNPAMLFIDTTPLMIVQICISSLVGMFGIAAALNGYLFRHMGWPARLLILAGGLLMMYPTVATDIIGLVLLVAVVLWQHHGTKKNSADAEETLIKIK